MSLPLKLFQLQNIDSQLDQANSKLARIDAELNEHSEINHAQDRARDLENNLDLIQNKLHQAEQDMQAQRYKIEQTESTLYSGKVTNPKELQDLQNEVTALKRYLKTLEDRVLELMLTVDEISTKYQKALEDLELTKSKTGEKEKHLFIEKKQIYTEIERLTKERTVFANSISEPVLQQYNQLRRLKRGVAVAQVIDRTCSACGSTLSASLQQSVSSLNQLIYCDTCGRILYGGK
jgi:hypothetical protein